MSNSFYKTLCFLHNVLFNNTEELYKKDLHDQDNHDGVINHLEPDILATREASGVPFLRQDEA